MPQREFILAIETSNPPQRAAVAVAGADQSQRGGAGVAVGRMIGGGCVELIAEERLRIAGRDDDLMPCIDRVFARSGVDRADLGLVAVSVGPGGFTATRVACAAGKVIADIAGAQCVAVPSAVVVAAGVSECAKGGPFGVALASKGETAYVTVFAAGGWSGVGAAPEGKIVSTGELGGLGIAALVGDEHLPVAMRAEAERLGMMVETPVFEVRACLEAGGRLAPCDPAFLVPLYPRQPEAVTIWRARGGPR